MKEAYIEKINELMEQSNDISLLDFIWMLLVKEGAINAKTC